MTIIYSKPQQGNFPASVVVSADNKADGLHLLTVRASSSLKDTAVVMTRQELMDLADAILVRFA